MEDKDHWAYKIALELHKESILNAQGEDSQGQPVFNLHQPLDLGSALGLIANLIYYSDNVIKALKRVKKAI